MGHPVQPTPVREPYSESERGPAPAHTERTASLAAVPPPERTLAPEGRVVRAGWKLGSSAGRAVVALRGLPEHLRAMGPRIRQIGPRLRQAGGHAAAEARSTADEVGRRSERALNDARGRARQLANDYPLQTIGLAAAAGLSLGIALRVWRDHA